MFTLKKATTLTAVALITASLTACGGGGNSADPTDDPDPKPKSAKSAITGSSYSTTGGVNKISIQGAELEDNGTTIINGRFPINQANITGLPGTTSAAGGVNDGNALAYQGFYAASTSTGTEAYASQDVSAAKTTARYALNTDNDGTTPSAMYNSTYSLNGNTWEIVVPVNYAYAIAKKGEPVVNATGGRTTGNDHMKFVGNKITAQLGAVEIDGTLNGTELSGTASLGDGSSASGTMSGYVGANSEATLTSPTNSPDIIAGTFEGNNSSTKDDTSFSGIFITP